MKKILFITIVVLCISAVPVYSIDANMVLVPGGWFPYQNQTPYIFVETFLIDKYETTNEQYCEFLNAADPNAEYWDPNQEIDRIGTSPPYDYTVEPNKENYPIGFVNFYDANAFAQWKSNVAGATYRLPTEQEWEKAAAWDPVLQYHYLYAYQSDDINCSWCNYSPACVGTTTMVGHYNGTGGTNDARSFYGCYDMSGNVWEWTNSEYISIPGNKVVRGGAWDDDAHGSKTIRRSSDVASNRTNRVGFRLVREPILLVIMPDGGESWVAGTQQTIQWQTSPDANIAEVKIEYSGSNGLAWQVIDSNTGNDGEYEWTIPMITSNQCLVRISDANDANIFDTSDNTFIIFECRLNSKADLDGNCKVDMTDFALFANDWLRNGNPFDENCTECPRIVWVYINDPGVSGHERFDGYMSKYETTNAQYCQFLNAALDSNDITVSGSIVYGADGSNSGADFVGQVYYNLAGTGSTTDGATNGGAARINYTDGSFTIDSGFENHSVTYVSWYGATAFCNYYGYRLPTEWEWQAVADYDGSFIYGCGTSINNSIANYFGSTHPDGTTVVGAFGTYGYGMCDMAGNVWEWMSNCWDSDCSYGIRVIRGGSWHHSDDLCTVSDRSRYEYPNTTAIAIGFRVCR